MENYSFRGNGYLKTNKLHTQCLLCFSHWPLTLILLPAPLIFHEHHLFLQSDRFDSSIFPPEAPTIWNSCSLPLHLIHLSSLCKSQLKTSIFPLAPIPVSLVLFSSIKHSYTRLRTRSVCKMLQTLSSPQNSYLWIHAAFKGTKNCPWKESFDFSCILKHVSCLMELKSNPHRLHLRITHILIIMTQSCKYSKEWFYMAT